MDRVAASTIGASVLAAALVFGLFFHAARRDRDTISVTGAASQRFESDVVKWSVTLSRQVGSDELGRGYREIRGDLARVRDRIVAAGVADSAIGVQPATASQRWDNFGNVVGWSVDQSLYVVAEEGGRALETLALDPAALIEGGVVLTSSRIEYFYSGIDSLKHELLGRATRDAARRASEIAAASDLEAGEIASASAGVFQITEPYSTEISAYGMHNTATRAKEITVTVHASFGMD